MLLQKNVQGNYLNVNMDGISTKKINIYALPYMYPFC